MNLAVFDDGGWRDLLPLTWLRSACELRVGRDRLIDKIVAAAGREPARFLGRAELSALRGEQAPPSGDDWLLVNSRVLLAEPVGGWPAIGETWESGGRMIAARVSASAICGATDATIDDAGRWAEWASSLRPVEPPAGVRLVRYPWELVQAGAVELARQCAKAGAIRGELHRGAHLVNEKAISIGQGAKIKPGVVLDAEAGPICIEGDVQVQANAVIEGPCWIGAGTIVRPTAVIRGGTAIGPVCRVGGEIEGSIFQGYGNKQHDGFLGHSYVGSWVNLGADTVTSDLKNTYGTIRVHLSGTAVETGLRFVGSTIGDHAKTGIGTILPTGCVVGTAAQVFTSGSVPQFVPSFSWLTDAGLEPARVDKIIEIARTVMQRRGVALCPAGAALLERVAAQARHVEEPGWKLAMERLA